MAPDFHVVFRDVTEDPRRHLEAVGLAFDQTEGLGHPGVEIPVQAENEVLRCGVCEITGVEVLVDRLLNNDVGPRLLLQVALGRIIREVALDGGGDIAGPRPSIRLE